MGKTFKLFYSFLLILCLSCDYSKQNKFNAFCNSFKELKLPICLNDTIEFNNWDIINFIDTSFIKGFNLVLDYNDSLYPLNSVLEFKCSAIGKITLKNEIILFYKMYTSTAGNGMPIVVLSIYNKESINKYRKVILWNDAEDAFYSQRVNCQINSNLLMELTTTKIYKELDNDKIILTKIEEDSTVYRINNESIEFVSSGSRNVNIKNKY